MEEVGDLLVEKEYLVESEQLYEELQSTGKAYKTLAYFGTGYKAYKVYISPNPIYKGFLDMRAGTTNKSEIMKEVVGDLTETKRLKEKLAEIELATQQVAQLKMEDLIPL
jgi:hypothetical protein